jgi:serine/threonine protein kinase
MPAPPTVDNFLGVLTRSQLLTADALEKYLNGLPAEYDSPEDLADQMVRDNLLTGFQAENLLKGRWMRFFVGPYKVLDRLGCGEMGAVYLCEHHRMRRRVAIKVLLSTKAKNEEALRRFEREARAAGTLDHPNIVHAFDVGREDRLHYLVLEYVNGLSLQELVQQQGPLSPGRAADYLRQAASGLQHAHEAGLVHRHVQPSNLMIDRGGVVKLLDLGLARFFEDDLDLTQGAVLGSVGYMAPEQAADSHSADARADIYGLGATFYFALTGKPPLPETLDSCLPRPRAAGEAGDFARLLTVLKQMMATAPSDRYQTAIEVVQVVTPWAWPIAPLAADPPQPTLGTVSSKTKENLIAKSFLVEKTPRVPVAKPPPLPNAPSPSPPRAPSGDRPKAKTSAKAAARPAGAPHNYFTWLWIGIGVGLFAVLILVLRLWH